MDINPNSSTYGTIFNSDGTVNTVDTQQQDQQQVQESYDPQDPPMPPTRDDTTQEAGSVNAGDGSGDSGGGSDA